MGEIVIQEERDMTTLSGGAAVRNGYYWNLGRWEVIPVERDGTALPGGRGDKFMKVPLLAAVLLLPIMGGLFVVALPFIAFALTLYAAVRPLLGLFHRSARDLASTVSPGWLPGEAHFTGKRAGEPKAEKGPPAEDERLEELEREIATRRGER
jgi:hypothetical protein